MKINLTVDLVFSETMVIRLVELTFNPTRKTSIITAMKLEYFPKTLRKSQVLDEIDAAIQIMWSQDVSSLQHHLTDGSILEIEVVR